MTRDSGIPRGSSRSGWSRRQVLQSIAVALTAVKGNRLSAEAAQHVHQQAKEERTKTGTFTPRTFTPHEFTTLRRLAELIIPADEISGSAAEAGAPEFIDLLCSQNKDLASVFTGGILWLDAEMRGNHSKVFIEASPEQQGAMLDRIVEADTAEQPRPFAASLDENSAMYREFELYTSRPAPGLRSGRVFFEWLRNLTVDAFYTSEMGIMDLGYRGNSVLEKYEVPTSIIEYALAHSPFKSSR